jgi:hypothetical protein
MRIFKERYLDDIVALTKGTDIYSSMLLGQYRNSPNLKAYAGAFLAEFDTLFEEAERMYLGRFLEYATGKQLSTLGKIVGISRELTLDDNHFGFLGEVGEIWADTFGTVGDSTVGGKFKSTTTSVIQLSDTSFRRAVRAKAFCNGASVQNVEFMYKVLAMMLGKVPSVFKLTHDHDIENKNHLGFLGTPFSGTFGTISDSSVGGMIYSTSTSYEYIAEYNNRIILTIEVDKVSIEALNLIKAMKPFFVPSGYQFVFNMI